jgi:hypothetical protein
MRITRFAAVLSLALAAAPTLMAATHFTPDTHATSKSVAVAMKLPANMELRSSLHSGVASSALFTFTATVNGSYDMGTNGQGYWFATVSGGTAPYTYYWYLDEWAVGGNSSSYMGYITTPGDHYIYVTVTDANNVTVWSNQFAIHVRQA